MGGVARQFARAWSVAAAPLASAPALPACLPARTDTRNACPLLHKVGLRPGPPGAAASSWLGRVSHALCHWRRAGAAPPQTPAAQCSLSRTLSPLAHPPHVPPVSLGIGRPPQGPRTPGFALPSRSIAMRSARTLGALLRAPLLRDSAQELWSGTGGGQGRGEAAGRGGAPSPLSPPCPRARHRAANRGLLQPLCPQACAPSPPAQI